MDPRFIRNFSIVAHIDHGKSTLADQLLLKTGTITQREFREQILDDLDVERERGITVKARAVAIHREHKGQIYELNLVDTPGHVDFHYEVSRSLAACEGALLLVDAFQGVQAQTVANAYAALEADLVIIPCINKIDLPVVRTEEVLEEMHTVLGIREEEVLRVSGKSGIGIDDVFEALIERIPAPTGDSEAPLKAMIFDGKYDNYRGVVTYVRMREGRLKRGMKITFMTAGTSHEVLEVGQFRPNMSPCDELGPGQVGYFIAGIKELGGVHVGDTVTEAGRRTATAFPGYKQPLQMVFCGMYPIEKTDFEKLREELSKMSLNDASFTFQPETSDALGFGFRCGFLGLLHLDIIRERLEREFNLSLITTAPSVVYKIFLTNGEVVELHNPADMPDVVRIEHIEEPWIKATILVPDEYLGSVLKLCEDRRGRQVDLTYAGNRALVKYDLPLNEVVFDFYDRLKSVSRGYASFDYHVDSYKQGDLVKMSILVNAEPVDALSMLVHRARAETRGRGMVEKMKELIPPHLFQIPIQAAIGGRIIARETVRALRKDVTAKCYGGDASRKRKLLDKQKAGKKRMRQYGNVEIPQEAFIAALKMDAD